MFLPSGKSILSEVSLSGAILESFPYRQLMLRPPGENRTRGTIFRKDVLCPLSYRRLLFRRFATTRPLAGEIPTVPPARRLHFSPAGTGLAGGTFKRAGTFAGAACSCTHMRPQPDLNRRIIALQAIPLGHSGMGPFRRMGSFTASCFPQAFV